MFYVRYVKILVYATLLAFYMMGCDGDNGTNPDDPVFSNLSVLNNGKIYVAYWKVKLDTVSLSFNHNSSVTSIAVAATIDSGKTWLDIPAITSNGPNSKIVRWTPKSSSSVPRYFGVKSCFIRITDLSTNKFVDSDTFPLIGPAPLLLLKSLTGNTYQIKDSIKVQYSWNQDLASNIQTYFKNSSDDIWADKEFTNDSKLPSDTAFPMIINQQKVFIPEYFISIERVGADYFTLPIQVRLKDYGVEDCEFTTGAFTIKTE
jgi:hypothetical protein